MLDTSGSMYGYQITLARVVAEKIIQSLSEHDLVNIILYNDTHTTGPSSCFEGWYYQNHQIMKWEIMISELYSPNWRERTQNLSNKEINSFLYPIRLSTGAARGQETVYQTSKRSNSLRPGPIRHNPILGSGLPPKPYNRSLLPEQPGYPNGLNSKSSGRHPRWTWPEQDREHPNFLFWQHPQTVW